MKFDQIMEKVEIKNSGSIYEYLFLNVDEESKIEYSNGNKFLHFLFVQFLVTSIQD